MGCAPARRPRFPEQCPRGPAWVGPLKTQPERTRCERCPRAPRNAVAKALALVGVELLEACVDGLHRGLVDRHPKTLRRTDDLGSPSTGQGPGARPPSIQSQAAAIAARAPADAASLRSSRSASGPQPPSARSAVPREPCSRHTAGPPRRRRRPARPARAACALARED